MQIADLIAEINARLEAACRVYYAGEEPLMTDAEYDQLVAQLEGLVESRPDLAPAAPVLTTVGTDTSGRIPHTVPMLSLENYYTVDSMCKWADSIQAALGLSKWPVFTIGSKFDGVSHAIDYKYGNLVQALTRGDGAAGESRLAQIKASPNIPSTLPEPVSFQVRGEIVIAQSTLNALNADLEPEDQYTSTRGLAAGTLKVLDPVEVARRKLLFRPWEVLLPPSGLVSDSAYQRLHDITVYGFAPPDDRVITCKEELIAAVEEMVPTLQAPEQEIGRDGLVFKVDSCAFREKLGRGNKYTKFQICFKAQNQRATSTILSIEWGVGRQGALTPVAQIDPVILGGAKIERATLNNITWIEGLGVRVGSLVSVVRNGDVIPGIAKVLHDPEAVTSAVVAPTTCPACNAEVIAHTAEDSKITTHSCENIRCSGRLRKLLEYCAGRTVLEVDGLAAELAGKLVQTRINVAPAIPVGEPEQRVPTSLFDLFDAPEEASKPKISSPAETTKLVTDLADVFAFQDEIKAIIRERGRDEAYQHLKARGFPAELTLKMVDSLEIAKTAAWSRWIPAMNIPSVGRRFGKVLAKVLQLQPEDFPQFPAKLAQITSGEIDGVGPVILAELHRYGNDPAFADLCVRLHAVGVRPQATVAANTGAPRPLEGTSFVITGDLGSYGKRDEVAAKLEALGAVSKSGVSKNVTVLIVGSAPGKDKVTKAEKLGVKQVGIDWLNNALASANN